MSRIGTYALELQEEKYQLEAEHLEAHLVWQRQKNDLLTKLDNMLKYDGLSEEGRATITKAISFIETGDI